MESARYNQRLTTVSQGIASVTRVNLAAAVTTWLIQLCNLVLPSTIFQLSLSWKERRPEQLCKQHN